MSDIGLPLLLLGAIWGLFSPLLKAVEMMNERRDKIFDPESKLTIKHRRILLYSDWLTLFLASYAFIAFVAILVYYSHNFVELMDDRMGRKVDIVYRTIAAVLLVFSLVGLVSGFSDFNTMRRFINDLENKSS